jgi:hypothetical protein
VNAERDLNRNWGNCRVCCTDGLYRLMSVISVYCTANQLRFAQLAVFYSAARFGVKQSHYAVLRGGFAKATFGIIGPRWR